MLIDVLPLELNKMVVGYFDNYYPDAPGCALADCGTTDKDDFDKNVRLVPNRWDDHLFLSLDFNDEHHRVLKCLLDCGFSLYPRLIGRIACNLSNHQDDILRHVLDNYLSQLRLGLETFFKDSTDPYIEYLAYQASQQAQTNIPNQQPCRKRKLLK